MQAIILAAGKGTRMNCEENNTKPKVMYPLNGIPTIKYGVDNLRNAGISDIIVVVGYKKEQVQDFFKDSVKYAIQEEQLGTGHAVMMAKNQLDTNDGVLVCCGDMPLFKSETIKHLIEVYHSEAPVISLLSVIFSEPFGYGRIVRSSAFEVNSIVEQKDCSPKQQGIKECNTGVYIFNGEWLKRNLSKLQTNNSQKEYYLTDLVELAVKQGQKVIPVPVADESEALGINTPEQLRMAEKVLKECFSKQKL